MAENGLQLHGFAELERDLRRLPRKIQGRVVRNATRAGAVVVRRRAKELAPRGETGVLRKGIVIRTQRNRGRNEIRVWVGLKGTAWYGWLHEFGTRFMPARPWLRPAFDSTRDEASRTVIARVWSEIRKRLT